MFTNLLLELLELLLAVDKRVLQLLNDLLLELILACGSRLANNLFHMLLLHRVDDTNYFLVRLYNRERATTW